MIKLILLFSFLFLFQTEKTVPLGEFYKSTGFESFRLKLTKDSLFEQTVWTCARRYVAKGNWELFGDTIKLRAQQIYKFTGKDKTERVDTSSNLYNYFSFLNSLVVLGNDTLGQVHGMRDSCVIKLPRQR